MLFIYSMFVNRRTFDHNKILVYPGIIHNVWLFVVLTLNNFIHVMFSDPYDTCIWSKNVAWARHFIQVNLWKIMYLNCRGKFEDMNGNLQCKQLPVSLGAQLVEFCTSITEVLGSNHVQAWIFYRLKFHITSADLCVTVIIQRHLIPQITNKLYLLSSG